MHRDISLNNILMYPRHVERSMHKDELSRAAPHFIQDVLKPAT